jgi:hypothetical protein
VDASQYKDYVLVLLFVKYISDKYAGQRDPTMDVPPGGGFANMDAEIAVLEAHRERTRLIKQGMIREFLTGRTRLV